MGWLDERLGRQVDDHEGTASYVVADGRLTSTSTRDGVLPDPLTDEVVSWAQVVGWQTACTCGWTGQRFDLDAVTITDSLGLGAMVDAEDALLATGQTVAEAAEQDWARHIEPLTALAAVRVAADALEQARHQLDEAVARARAGGASWADVGRAARMSKQAAHERWG